MKIAIIGAAGSVGSCVAFNIAAQGLADEILMIGGSRQNHLQHHAMDISTGVSCLDVKVYPGGYEDLGGSEIVINTAGVSQGLIADRMEMLPKNIPLVRDIAQHIRRHCPEAIVINACNPIDPLNYAMYLAGDLDPNQLIGYSLNDSLRFRELVAAAKGVEVSRVGGTVIGEHGSTQVLLFSSARIDGKPVTFETAEKERIRRTVPTILRTYEELQTGRTAGWTCAVGVANLVRAIVEDAGKVFPCSVMLDGQYGCRNLSMGVPVIVGRGGVSQILEWQLAADEEEGLAVTTQTLRAATRIVEAELA
jgi:malate/lactate dehydrogenase